MQAPSRSLVQNLFSFDLVLGCPKVFELRNGGLGLNLGTGIFSLFYASVWTFQIHQDLIRPSRRVPYAIAG